MKSNINLNYIVIDFLPTNC